MPEPNPNPPATTPPEAIDPPAGSDPDLPGDTPAIAAKPSATKQPPQVSEDDTDLSPTREPEDHPMLDVHPAQHAANTWREFFIHIATITLGLLIAIGLEQTVEAIHRNLERHQLEFDLHAECVRNDAILSRDIRLMSIKRADTVALRNQVEARLHGAKTLPDLPPENQEDTFKPSEGVWSSARDSSQLALLPRELTEMYEELYAQPQYVRDFVIAWFNAADNLRNFENQFPTHTPSGHVDLTKLNPDQLNQYSALLTRLITQNESLAAVLGFYQRENKIVLNGAASGEELQERMAAP